MVNAVAGLPVLTGSPADRAIRRSWLPWPAMTLSGVVLPFAPPAGPPPNYGEAHAGPGGGRCRRGGRPARDRRRVRQVRRPAVLLLPVPAPRARGCRRRRAGHVPDRHDQAQRPASPGQAPGLAVRRGPERVLPPAALREAHVRSGGRGRPDRRSGRRLQRRRAGRIAPARPRRARRPESRRAGRRRAEPGARAGRRRTGRRAPGIPQPRARAAVPGPQPAGTISRRAAGRAHRPGRLRGSRRPAGRLGRPADRADAQADQPARRALRGLRRAQAPRAEPGPVRRRAAADRPRALVPRASAEDLCRHHPRCGRASCRGGGSRGPVRPRPDFPHRPARPACPAGTSCRAIRTR